MNRNALWDTFFGTPDCVKNYHFYSYEYLDDCGFMPSASEMFSGWPDGETLIARVEERLKYLGCKGEGTMQIMWLPPFVGAGDHNNYGCYVLHYKQLEDGISWLASPFVLPFHRLFQPDDFESPRPSGRDRLDERIERNGLPPYWPGNLGNF
ncbi:MAG: hypothetical protein H6R05_83 [Burkholderiaceae bacterium]|nr:hypothetical protein [Burkholderiaceae bacterium]